MDKKRIILLLSVFFAIIFVAVLFSTVFRVKEIELNFYNTNDSLIEDISTQNNYYKTEEDVDNIIKRSGIEYGKNVLLLKKQKYIDIIEKNNPYIRVVDIEIVFPNKIKIKVAERESVFYAKYQNKFYILDGDLKVLSITQSSELVANLIYINFEESENEVSFFNYVCNGEINYSEGDFLNIKEEYKSIYKLKTSSEICNMDTRDYVSIITNITLYVREATASYNIQYNNWLKLQTYQGVKIVIEDINNNFENKFIEAYKCYNYLINNEFDKSKYGSIKILVDTSGNISSVSWSND